MKSYKLWCGILAFAVLCTVSASAATYHVSNSGNDGNSGTNSLSPWQTIAQVMKFKPKLQPGDSVLFQRGGVWYEQLDVSGVNGTASAPITFGNYGLGDLPVIDGGSTRQFGIVAGYSPTYSLYDSVGSTYITIDGFEVRNTTEGGIIFIDYPFTGLVVQNNYVHDLGYGAYPGACSGCYQVDHGYGGSSAIAFFFWKISPSGIKFLNNTVKVVGGHNCMMIDGDTGGPVIQGNFVGPGCSHNSIDFKNSQNMLVIQNNLNCEGSITVNGSVYPSCNGHATFALNDNTNVPSYTMRATIEQNVMHQGSPKAGGCFASVAPYAGPISLNFYNNTCYLDNGAPWPFYLESCLRGGTLAIENNVFYGGGKSTMGGTSCNITWDYNDKYQNAGDGSGSHDLSVDPLFVNPNGMDFHLQAMSPVLNAGNPNIIPGVTWMGALGTGTSPSSTSPSDTTPPTPRP